MKKIVLMAVIAMCAVFTSQSQAQNILSNDKTQVEKQDKFYEIPKLNTHIFCRLSPICDQC